MKYYDKYQFAIWRILFGLYILFYFVRLFPYSVELFSSDGAMPNPAVNLTHGIFPNILDYYDSAYFIISFFYLMIIFSFFFTIGYFRRTSSFFLWYGWACMFNRNNLTEDPVLPYIGWLLMACALIPSGEPLSISKPKNKKWEMPAVIYYGAWLILGLSYTVTGIEKYFAPSWKNGLALKMIYESSIAWKWPLTAFMISLPLVLLKIQTWFAMALQTLSLPLYIFRKTRFWGWLVMTITHLIVLLTLDLVQVSLGILLFHLFVFDYRWKKTYFGNFRIFSGIRKLCISGKRYF